MSSQKSSSAGPAKVVEVLPPAAARSALSVWLVVHLALLAISLSAVAAASVLQIRLLDFASIYLTPLQLRVDGRPIYLTHGEPDDQTHRVQWLRAGESEWETATVTGWRGSERLRRHSRYIQTIARAAESEETAVASLLALPLVRQVMTDAEANDRALPVRMRIVRYAPNMQLRQYPREPVETPRWEAAIVREPDRADGLPHWSLVTVKERRLNALSADAGEPSPSDAPERQDVTEQSGRETP